MKTIKEMVKDKRVHFDFCRGTSLYYKTDDNFLFEIPISDLGDAVMPRDDKAILYMRWIRKQMEANKEGMADSIS